MAFNPFTTLFDRVKKEATEFAKDIRGGAKIVKEAVIPETKFTPSSILFKDVVKGLPRARKELKEEFTEGFRGGALSAAGALQTIGAIGLKKVGFDQVSEKLRATAKKDFELAQVGIDITDDRKFTEAVKDPKFIARGIGQNLPNFMAAMGAGVVGGLVAGPPGAIVGALTTAGALEAGFAFEEAKSFGVDDERAEKIAVTVGIINGILEALPITRLLRKLPAGKQIKDKILRKATRDVVIQTGQESGTESLQEIVSNVVASTYDENRELFAGVPESAFFGGLIGGGASVSFNAVSTIPIGSGIEDVGSIKRKIADTPGNTSMRAKQVEIALFNIPEEDLAGIEGIRLVDTREGENRNQAFARVAKEEGIKVPESFERADPFEQAVHGVFSVGKKIIVGVSSSMDLNIAHEIGHVVYSGLSKTEIAKILSDFNKQINFDAIRTHGRSNVKEYFAEIYANKFALKEDQQEAAFRAQKATEVKHLEEPTLRTQEPTQPELTLEAIKTPKTLDE